MKFKPSYTSSIAEDIMAERLIRAQAVEFLADAPMRLKSGLISPVYVDNRKLFRIRKPGAILLRRWLAALKNTIWSLT